MNRANLFAVLASVVLASSLGGCQCVLGLDTPALYPGGGGGTGGTGGSGGGCVSADDCPPPGSECIVATCEDGICGTGDAPEGAPCGDAPSCSGGEQVHQDICDGAGVCLDQGTLSCGTYACGATACKTSCMDDSDCTAGTQCKNPPNGSCVGSKTNGEPCTAPVECDSGYCADGVCCNTPCGGHCEACSSAAGGKGPDGQCASTLICGEPLAAGKEHACSVRPSGVVQCWGGNLFGQLGDGTADSSPVPQAVADVTMTVGVAAGDSHTCALIADGTVKCWGQNSQGQLGDGTMSDKLTPVGVDDVSDAIAVSAGGQTSCAVIKSGTVRCWGNNSFGQLGNNSTMNKSSPVTVNNISTAVAVAVGSAHACALLADGTVQCWGLNASGQVGDGTFDPMKLTPAPVLDVANAVQVAVGDFHSCAVLSTGSSRCWGENGGGQLGCGGCDSDQSAPVTVINVFGALASAGGGHHSCVRTQNGQASCWGTNFDGQLGDGTTDPKTSAVAVKGLSTIVSIHAGAFFTCAALSDGSVACWGSNLSGQLGDGSDMGSTIPSTVISLSY